MSYRSDLEVSKKSNEKANGFLKAANDRLRNFALAEIKDRGLEANYTSQRTFNFSYAGGSWTEDYIDSDKYIEDRLTVSSSVEAQKRLTPVKGGK